MTIEEIEAQAMRLDRKARAQLAERLLASLEDLSREELDALWAEEAERRNAELEANPSLGRGVEDVFRDLAAKLR
jgi:putative addiction module component (TIGR02574 family)